MKISPGMPGICSSTNVFLVTASGTTAGSAPSFNTTAVGDSTTDGGATWKELRHGLPQQCAYDVVYRHALANKEGTLAFGSTTGNLQVTYTYTAAPIAPVPEPPSILLGFGGILGMAGFAFKRRAKNTAAAVA